MKSKMHRMPSDRQEFHVVFNGGWHRLASLQEHVRAGVPPDGPEYLLYDSGYRAIRAPKGKVYFSSNPGQTGATT